MIETKSWDVQRAQENEFLETWPYFGWTVKSNSDFRSDLGNKGVKITCTRDTTMPNYQRLKQLGETYERIAFSEPARLSAFQAVAMTIITFGFGLIVIGIMAIRRKSWKKKMATIAKPALEEAMRLMEEKS